jgi:arylsulfatase A-like enzyme
MTIQQLAAAAALCLLCLSDAWGQPKSHNVILFISDGLRAASVAAETAPVLARVKKSGVEFSNSHSLYPTVTTANASAIATGHYLGDTGDFGNTLYFGFPVWAHGGAPTTFLENDAVLGEINEHFAGNYLNEESLVTAAQKAGFATAVLGKVGPSFIQNMGNDPDSIVIDDTFGHAGGLPVPASLLAALRSAGLATQTPDTTWPDIEQESYLANAAAKVVLPRLAASGKPFVFVFWCRDPDISQHNGRESIGQLEPGINGPTGRAAIRNASDTLQMLMDAVHTLGIDDTTDLFVTADHGFATIAKASLTSAAAHFANPDGPPADLPSGFLAIDLANGLGHSPLFDPDDAFRPVDYANGGVPSGGDGFIGADPAKPEVVVTANGGSDLIYLPQNDAPGVAADVVQILLKEDYVSGIFVDDKLGAIPGTLPLSRINLAGDAVTIRPSIVVNFRSFSTSCADPLFCTVIIADTGLRRGQGNHGSFSRAETFNFMAAAGPDFKAGFVDEAPVSNADIAPTLARILGISLPSKGKLAGRVISESLKGGEPVSYERQTLSGPPTSNGLATVLNFQKVGTTTYFDAAGFAGRTVGLEAPAKP